MEHKEQPSYINHRKRVKEKFLKDGFTEGTKEYEVLELVLFYCIPRVDTKEIAKDLLRKFGSLEWVFNAPAEELKKFPGITDNGVVLLRLMIELTHICAAKSVNSKTVFSCVDEIGTYLLGRYAGITDERFAVVCLQNNGNFISFDFIGDGDKSSVGVSTRKIIEIVIEHKATMIVIAHNHPGGLALPSGTDLETTKRISEALKHIGVRLFDHIVIADGDFVSFAQSEQFREYLK